MRKIFVNLPVKDLPASTRFFEGLGFAFNPNFTDETAACMVVSDTIFVMLLTHARFRDFLTGEISDTSKGTEVLTCLSVESREEVDALVEKAVAQGGTPWKPPIDQGGMHGGSFQDLDGHVWELVHLPTA